MSRNLKLYIETFTERNELDPAAGVDEGWQRIGHAFFKSIEMTGREYMQAQQMQATVTHKFESEYLAGMTPLHRLTAGEDVNDPERIFNVKSVIDVKEQHRKLEWMVEEKLSG
jgi:SPP1 family predicted phage head-tail adaptor